MSRFELGLDRRFSFAYAGHYCGLLSNPSLKNRLPLEPDWTEQRPAAAVNQLVELWPTQRLRVEKHAGEQMLEEQFIQPLLRLLGWRQLMLCQTLSFRI